MKPVAKIDSFLDRTTMYRLVVYVLSAYAAVGLVFSGLGVVSLSLTGLLLSLVVLMCFGFLSNQLLSRLYRVPYNFESGIITTLILFCILPPVTTLERGLVAGLVVTVAMASKYILTWRYRHIFNPAAIALVLIGLTDLTFSSWWIGSPWLLPFTLVGGLLIMRKLRRFGMVVLCIFTALVLMLITDPADQSTGTILRNAFLSWPLIFFATIMLTEPSTTPPTRYYQNLYAVLVGTLFASRLDLGPLTTTPEVALVLGNLFAYAVSPKYNLRLKLKTKKELTQNVFELTFRPDKKPTHKAGQYMEWTLPLGRLDTRGNRRTFTIASSPTEKDIKLGVKFYQPSSEFKKQLQSLKPGQTIMAGHIAGDFTLPMDKSEKLVWIAGGIGITPFRSMAQYLIDTNQQRDVTLFYLISSADSKAYSDLLNSARSAGIATHYVVAPGTLEPELLKKKVGDYAERAFYISGPPGMVNNYKKMLIQAGVSRRHIRTDYFSGY